MLPPAPPLLGLKGCGESLLTDPGNLNQLRFPVPRTPHRKHDTPSMLALR